MKNQYPTPTLHGVTTLKTSTWNITAVKSLKNRRKYMGCVTRLW